MAILVLQTDIEQRVVNNKVIGIQWNGARTAANLTFEDGTVLLLSPTACGNKVALAINVEESL